MEDILRNQHIREVENDREYYSREINRLGSYARWPRGNPMFPTALAKVGLYYTGQEDEVKCFVCDIRMKRWVKTDLPLSEHERHSPRCQFILGYNIGNVPLLAEGEVFSLDKIRDEERNVKQLRASISQTSGASSGALSHNNNNAMPSLFTPNFSFASGLNTNFPRPQVAVKDSLASLQPNYRGLSSQSPVVADAGLFSMPAPAITGPREPQTRISSNSTSSTLPQTMQNMSLADSDNFSRPVASCRTEFDSIQTDSSHTVPNRQPNTGRIQTDSVSCNQGKSVSTFNVPATPGAPEELCNPARVREMMHHAAHPQYADIAIRFRSFRLWQSESIQPIARMCQAGFFYTGQDDRVRCFMCGGGLCNWESDDVPWQEHARWFNRCEYLDACRNVPEVQTAINNMQNSLRADGGSRTDVESVRTDNVAGFMNTSMVKEALEMGFTRERIKDAVRKTGRAFADLNDLLDTLDKLAIARNSTEKPAVDPDTADSESDSEDEDETKDAAAAATVGNKAASLTSKTGGPAGTAAQKNLTSSPSSQRREGEAPSSSKKNRRKKRKAKKQKDESNQPPQPTGGGTEKSAVPKEDLSNLISENQALRDKSMCKICLTNEVAIVFLPCSHLACCLDCAMQLQKCPICREHIKATVKVFIG